jgi:hypothetical protein
VPYYQNALLTARIRLALANESSEEIHRICSQYGLFDDFKEANLSSKVEEMHLGIHSSSTGREGRN